MPWTGKSLLLWGAYCGHFTGGIRFCGMLAALIGDWLPATQNSENLNYTSAEA
jgi:hypothetical protein